MIIFGKSRAKTKVMDQMRRAIVKSESFEGGVDVQ